MSDRWVDWWVDCWLEAWFGITAAMLSAADNPCSEKTFGRDLGPPDPLPKPTPPRYTDRPEITVELRRAGRPVPIASVL